MHGRSLSERHVLTAYQGRFFTIECHEWVDGERSVRCEVLRHPGAVLIIPILEDGRIVFIRNYRLATESWLLELPAGTREPHEDAATTAGRELQEETGYTAGRLTQLGAFYTTPGLTDELMQVFLAESLTAGRTQLEPWEQIEVELVDRSDALDRIYRGELIDGKSIVALQLLALRDHAG